MGILKFDVLKLKVATFTYKIINFIEKVPSIFSDTVQLASSKHGYNTRFSSNTNFSRPNLRTNYRIYTFRYASSKIWESLDDDLKQSSSINILKKNYRQQLLFAAGVKSPVTKLN